MKRFLNKKTLLVAALAFVLSASAAFGAKVAWLHFQESKKEDACLDVFQLMCVKARDCGVIENVEECDKLVVQNEMCSVVLPELHMINKCEQQLRQIACTDPLPPICLLFVE